jgi:nitroreductase
VVWKHAEVETNAETVLTTTRAVRKRLDLSRSVPRDVVLDCVRVAMQAPTGSNAQGWRFVVVTDGDKRRRLAELYREGGADYLRLAAQNVKDEQTDRVYRSALYLMDVLERVPVHVVPCTMGRQDGAANPLAAPFYGSIFPAVWSFMLAARARGLGTVLTTLHLFREESAAELLGIPYDKVAQIGLVPLAYTTGGDFAPAQRPPADTITAFEEWRF